jgi:predicted RND superfamily exporter protein
VFSTAPLVSGPPSRSLGFGAKIGISIGVALVVLSILVLGSAFLLLRRKRSQRYAGQRGQGGEVLPPGYTTPESPTSRDGGYWDKETGQVLEMFAGPEVSELPGHEMQVPRSPVELG